MRIYPLSKPLALSLLALLALSGCKKKDSSAEGDQDASVSASAKEAKEGESTAPTGPCDELATKLCKEAGEKSPTCSGAQSTLPLLTDVACSAALKDFASTQAKLKEKAKDCDKLIEVLCQGVGPDTKSCGLVREKTITFPPEQCTQMLGQKDEIIASLKAEELKNQPLSTELQKLIASDGAPSFGPADAKVTIVEFSDFECPYCSRAANVTTQVKKKYGDKVRFVFRQFPLSFHKNAQGAAEASMAAHAQGKFWEFHDLMFENQRKLGTEDLEGYAKQLGLDVAQFKQAMESHKFADQVKSDIELGSRVAVGGTPTLFINGERVSNPTDFAAVSQEIDKALGS